MPTALQFRRGTNEQNNAFTGAAGEITYDTTNKTLRTHDGATAGGSILATQTYVNDEIGNISTTSISDGNSSVEVTSSNGNIAVSVGGTANVGVFTDTGLVVTGNITGGNLITAGLVSLSSITKTGTTGVGNIGSSSNAFDTVFAKSTSAQYADLAEMYRADQNYGPGTVLIFGGSNEVTESSIDHDPRVAGIVSTDPAFIMNSELNSDNKVAVALTGRVPCRVKGIIEKGDRLVASNTPGIACKLDIARYEPGCIIGKALESWNNDTPGVIEVVVGRL